MKADRTRPVRFYNRRLRKLSLAFHLALRAKIRRCERDEAFEALYAPLYRDYGRRVDDADRARAIREADKVAYQSEDAEVLIVNGRIIIADRRT